MQIVMICFVLGDPLDTMEEEDSDPDKDKGSKKGNASYSTVVLYSGIICRFDILGHLVVYRTAQEYGVHANNVSMLT